MKKRRPATARAATPSATLLASALGALGEGVFLADRRWHPRGLRIRFANTVICGMAGWSAREFPGRYHSELHADPAHLADLRRWHSKLKAGHVFTGEGHLTRRNGTRLYCTWTFSPVPDARGRITHIAITYRDMTDKQRLQEALVHSQRLDAVGRLAGGVAHDFNNLLSVINGYCEILGSKPDIRLQGGREIEEIHRAGRHAAGLVRQLLAFSRRQAMETQVISLNQLARDNAPILAKFLQPDKSLGLSLEATRDHVRVDPAQLQQVILNLTLNARDALPPGGKVTLATEYREEKAARGSRLTDMPAGRYVLLTVSDNGCGMDEETLSHLFEPFFTTKEHGKGTGLGLALVYGVVQQSGGYIFVRSARGTGTMFEIFLPLADEPAEPQEPPLAALPATHGRETIVLLEEDGVVCKMVAGILTADGYRVFSAGTPAEALKELRHQPQPVHLLIANLGHLPDEVERLARTLHAAHAGLRVLGTGNTESPAFPWLAPEAQGGIVKPYALSTVLRAVRALLDGQPLPV